MPLPPLRQQIIIVKIVGRIWVRPPTLINIHPILADLAYLFTGKPAQGTGLVETVC